LKNIILTLIYTSIISFAFGQNSVSIKGKVTDQDNKPVQNAKVFLLMNGKDSCMNTDKEGNYIFKGIVRDDIYIISCGKINYMSRINYYMTDSANGPGVIDIPFRLRERKAAKINTASIDSTDLGITLKEAIIKYKLDTTECRIQNEPFGVSRGIVAESGDSTMIYLAIKSKSNFETLFSNILNEKVISIGLVFSDCTKKQFGEEYVTMFLRSPYCRQE